MDDFSVRLDVQRWERRHEQDLAIRRESNSLQREANALQRSAQDQAAHQAALAQGLFEMEQSLPGLRELAKEDAGAAAILACTEVVRAASHGLSADALPDLVAKRAFGDARAELERIVAKGAGVVDAPQAVDVLQCYSEMVGKLSEDPHAYFRRVTEEHGRARTIDTVFLVLMLCACVLALVGFVWKYNGWAPFDAADRESVVWAMIVGAVPWIVGAHAINRVRLSFPRHLLRDYRTFENWYRVSWASFEQHPEGLPLVRKLQATAPLVVERVSKRLLLGPLPVGTIVFIDDPTGEDSILRSFEHRVVRQEPGYCWFDTAFGSQRVRIDRVHVKWGYTRLSWET